MHAKEETERFARCSSFSGGPPPCTLQRATIKECSLRHSLSNLCQTNDGFSSYAIVSVPEPASVQLALLGLAAVLLVCRRKNGMS